MKIVQRNDSGMGGGIISPRPSFFDYCLYFFACISPIAFWLPWDLNMFQRLFFVFSVLALLILSLILKKEIEYKNKSLTVFLLGSFVICMLHSMALKTPEIVQNYVLFTYMVEGFFYIFAAVMLFWLTVTYSRKFNIVYPIIFINVLNLIFVISQLIHKPLIFTNVPTICGLMGTNSQLALFSAVSIPILLSFWVKKIWYPVVLIPVFNLCVGHSFTAIFALVIGTIIYLRICRGSKDFLLRSLVVLIPIIPFMILSYKELFMKAWVRWDLLVSNLFILTSNPIIGNGYDNGLTMNKTWSNVDNAMAFRHNDFLNFAHDLGIPLAVLLFFIVIRIIKSSKANYVWIATIVLLIGSCFQTNLYFPRIAIIAILLLGILERNRLGQSISLQ